MKYLEIEGFFRVYVIIQEFSCCCWSSSSNGVMMVHDRKVGLSAVNIEGKEGGFKHSNGKSAHVP